MHVGQDVLEESELPPETNVRGRPNNKLEDTKRQYDKECFKSYYTTNIRCKIPCDNCDRHITKTNTSRHRTST